MSIEELITAGLAALREYIALHVITCLIPAFLLAGAMVTFISRETILRYMGSSTRKIISFPLAAFSSFFLAVCSCTVIPVAAGLYKRGGGIGPTFILLWVAPASNILALIYTGAILGYDMAVVRVVAAVSTAILIGLVMNSAFREEEAKRTLETPGKLTGVMSKKDLVLILLIVISLLAPNYLVQKGPYMHKVYVWFAGTVLLTVYALAVKSKQEIKNWLNETWWFAKIIFPLLLIGVFIVGVVGKILPETWVKTWLGGSGLLPSFLATLIGAISYFATMTEAPFVDTLIKLGMGKGPALALLLAGPGLSLPSMLAIAKIFGKKKACVYIFSIIILATAVGFIAGNIVF